MANNDLVRHEMRWAGGRKASGRGQDLFGKWDGLKGFNRTVVSLSAAEDALESTAAQGITVWAHRIRLACNSSLSEGGLANRYLSACGCSVSRCSVQIRTQAFKCLSEPSPNSLNLVNL